MSGGFDVEFERDVLAQSLRDEAYLRKALPVLSKHSFTDKTNAWIWKNLSEMYENTRELPSGRIWVTLIEHGFRTEEDANFTSEVLITLRRRKVKTPKSALDQLRRFVRMAAIRKGGDAAMDALERGDIDEAERALTEGVDDARGAGLLAAPTDWLSALEERLALYMTTEKRMVAPFPLETLNKLVCGGLPTGRCALVVANTNVGKSGFAVDVGFTAVAKGAAQGWVCVHISTEESEFELNIRYDARLSGINKDKLASGDLDADDLFQIRERARKRGPEFRNRLFTHELPPGSSVAGVRAALEHARELHPTVPILLVVDSPDHLLPTRKMDNNRLEQSAVYWYMKALTMMPNTLGKVACWCTTQAPGAFEGKTLTTKAVSESYDKARIADFMLGLMEGALPTGASASSAASSAVPVQGIITKNRLTRAKRWMIYMDADMGICRYKETSSKAPAAEEE